MTDLTRCVLLALLVVAAGCGRDRSGVESPAMDSVSAIGTAPSDATVDTTVKRVTLSAAALRTSGIVVAPARGVVAGTVDGAVEAPGQVQADPARTALVSSRAAGRVERLAAVVGDRVAAGQAVAFVQSAAFVQAQSDYRQALRRAATLSGTTDSTGARALVEAARGRLRLFGVDAAGFERLAADSVEPLLPVTAPFAGSLVEAMTMAGAAVEAGTPIFRLVDLREVDIAADVAERFLPVLRVGQRATVHLAAYPDRVVGGRVERINDELDPTTRTVTAIIHVANRGHALRPGMFATVVLQAETGAIAGPDSGVAVPASAVLTEGPERFAFVEVGPRTFERRVLRLAPDVGVLGGDASRPVVVLGGLRAGERVVVRGGFVLKSELAKAGFAEED